jgi:glycogen debranching enzyme
VADVTDASPIVERYFSEIEDQNKSKVAHNGYIVGQHAANEDLAMVGWHYLRRSLNVWTDNAKLRYGAEPADCPELWSYIRAFVEDMASVSDGFRLYSTHSTPLHVSQYMLQAARIKNPNLIVVAELFSERRGAVNSNYASALNVNYVVRELQESQNSSQIATRFCDLNNCGGLDQIDSPIESTFLDICGRPYKTL